MISKLILIGMYLERRQVRYFYDYSVPTNMYYYEYNNRYDLIRNTFVPYFRSHRIIVMILTIPYTRFIKY